MRLFGNAPRTLVVTVALTAMTRTPGAAAFEPEATADDEPARPAAGDGKALEQAYRTEPDDKQRTALVQRLAGAPGGAEILARIVADDPSDDVALTAAHILRRMAVGKVVGLLERRLQAGKRDTGARERMLRELERHQVFAAGQNLPHWLREAPPVFTAKAADHRNVRVLAFGDFGDGSDRQARMAAAMRRYHAKHPVDLAVTVGDNFYPAGMGGPQDARWDRDFARLYEAMRVPFFPTLGNHDWALADSPAAEIAHSDHSKYWRMPAARYTFVAGPIQFFAIDTDLNSRAQLEWLDRELARSKARWKIVYGHHPVYSNGAHGDDTAMRETLLPLLRGRASIYLCGHDHDLQHLAPEEGVHFVLAGGGGAAPRPVVPGPRLLFGAGKNGFVVIEATRTSLAVTFLDQDLETLHRFALPD